VESRREIERKVITALFCDVVGSTDMAERLDPEDVERLLSTYHGRARRVIEAHGGTVEKFIGDAVVGVFGAPATHEDDPARAVRASLAILHDVTVSGLELHVRIGVHTGEAVVRVDGGRAPEESLATGGSMNIAARIQGMAPVDGVAVGDQTYRLAAREFEWEDLGSVPLKGIAEPVHIWRPTEARATAHRAEDGEATPFVGREAELEALRRAFESAVARSALEAVTVISEPGLGKSRLIRELGRHVRAVAPTVVWRVGRCLPYGDGITFWALGEIVKTHAGILETDDQVTIRDKLDTALTEPDPALRAWMRERLAPLAGLQTDAIPPSQEEAFAAWRRFLESFAADGPAVIVIEDLHWADSALVAFLLQLVTNPPTLPILLVVAMRPEAAERHPEWLTGQQAARVIQLVSLDDAAIAALVESTLAGAAPELLRTVLDRAAGSPLYAEQLAALVRERGTSATEFTLDERAIPPTIQALLAARIDALPRELKPAILDASVIGRVFWSGAVASLEGTDRGTVEPTLSDLERRSLTRSNLPSTMVGEVEYGFWHALLRDVAYGFLSRATRLGKHRAAAAWITDKAGDALGDLAEIVVDHLRRAEELAVATGADDELTAIHADLATALLAAADHLLRVNPARAAVEYGRALELVFEDDPRRGAVLAALGGAFLMQSEYPRAAELLNAAHDWYLARGDDIAAAELSIQRRSALHMMGNEEAATAAHVEGLRIFEAAPGPGLMALLANHAHVSDELDPQVRLDLAREAIAIGERLGAPVPASAHVAIGLAKLDLDDASGEADVRRGVDLDIARGDTRQVLTALTNLAWSLMNVADTRAARSAYDEALVFAKDHGLADVDLRANRLDLLSTGGWYDEALAEAAVIREWAAARGDAYATTMARANSAGIMDIRGEPVPDYAEIIAASRTLGWPLTPTANLAVRAAILRGDPGEARRVIDEAVDGTPEGTRTYSTLDLVRSARELGDLQLAHKVLSRATPPGPTSRGQLTRLAMAEVAEAEGSFAEAHAAFSEATSFSESHGWPMEHAIGLAGIGRCLVGLGDRDAGLAAVRQARAIAEPLRAAPFIAELDAFLAANDA
jgi:class 3 adenylate cyclase/tetratricopeptide (TPR) repeat protein